MVAEVVQRLGRVTYPIKRAMLGLSVGKITLKERSPPAWQMPLQLRRRRPFGLSSHWQHALVWKVCQVCLNPEQMNSAERSAHHERDPGLRTEDGVQGAPCTESAHRQSSQQRIQVRPMDGKSSMPFLTKSGVMMHHAGGWSMWRLAQRLHKIHV